MKRFIIIVITVFVVCIAAFLGIRAYSASKILATIVMVPEEPSPLDSLPIHKMEIPMEDRMLVANFLPAEESAPAIFICTGNGEALYEWLPVQKYLNDHGYSSYVFSYSGFGNSSGEPSRTSLYEDARAAYDQFIELTPGAKVHYGLSHSLGGIPLLGIVNEVDPPFDKIIVHAAFSSARELMIELGMIPHSFRWLTPDLFNNKINAQNVTIPVLYVHSKDDQTIPYKNSERLYQETGGKPALLLTENFGHNAIYQNVSDSLYQPILEFLNCE